MTGSALKGPIGLDPDLLRRAVARLRRYEPQTIAVLVTGSYAKGLETLTSDLDLLAITRRRPRMPYRMWFEQRTGERPLHVSAGAQAAADWKEGASAPAPWAFGCSAREAARFLFATPKALALLGEDPSRTHPPAAPELEDLVEALRKVERAALADDALGVRLYAQVGASLAPRCLFPINPPRVAEDRRDALEAALSLEVAPAHYAEDLATCLGLRAESPAQVAASALRLGEELLALLRERAPGIDVQPEIARYLADGTLERSLRAQGDPTRSPL